MLTQLGQSRQNFWQFYRERYPNDGVREGWAASNFYYYVEGKKVEISQLLAVDGVGLYIASRLSQADYYRESFETVRDRAERCEEHLDKKGIFSEDRWSGGAWRSALISPYDPKNRHSEAEWLHTSLTKCQQALEDFTPQSPAKP